MYQFAYSSIVEELPPPPPSHNRKISKAIELIEAAECGTRTPHERLQLLSDFRRLWLSIANDLLRAGGDGAETPREGLLLAAESVLKEIEGQRFQTSAGNGKNARAEPPL